MPSRKPHLDTRRALVESAWFLWSTRGYANTSVNAIIDHAGLSKGTFYHWFDSRAALLDAVVDLMVEGALGRVRAAVAQTGTAREQLCAYLASSRSWRFAHAPGFREVMAALYDPANDEIRLRVRARTVALGIEQMRAILERGVEDGSLEVEDPALNAEYLVHMGQTLVDLQIRDLLRGGPDDLDRVVRRAVHHLKWMEAGLGLEPGDLSDLPDGFREGLRQFTTPGEEP